MATALPERVYMNPEQFAALAELLQMRQSSDARQLAELILVNGLSVGEAADQLGVKYQRAHDALKRAERGIELARTTCGVTL